MKSKKCLVCKTRFYPCAQVPKQRYCSSLKCQRERRRRSHHEKMKSDPDYRDNQSRAQQDWLKRNPDYWRTYRSEHPEYSEKNREKQRVRNRQKRRKPIAKIHAPETNFSIDSGLYALRPISRNEIAKMDEWIVEIKLISKPSAHDDDCKEST